ncbi:unnamed protein product [Lepeophtheirus salmonis]|uniref:(salmon louse) hypothetical protein n=1 Tax=Lepeophtheirus salmonis TaxID=72036 RepID=A0A7R8CJJ6_LEPSM|nr:unnamed protein product [Lepeophtheirus salmonis]CAF2837065.1 unnamed protein product [Lepeophtheirus salmonis]
MSRHSGRSPQTRPPTLGKRHISGYLLIAGDLSNLLSNGASDAIVKRIEIEEGSGPHFSLPEVGHVFREPIMCLLPFVDVCFILLYDIAPRGHIILVFVRHPSNFFGECNRLRKLLRFPLQKKSDGQVSQQNGDRGNHFKDPDNNILRETPRSIPSH